MLPVQVASWYVEPEAAIRDVRGFLILPYMRVCSVAFIGGVSTWQETILYAIVTGLERSEERSRWGGTREMKEEDEVNDADLNG